MQWPEPLDRVISFRAADLSLREALDRLAAVSRLRVSYSSESLELNRIVCVSLDSVPVGEVFAELLRGSGVEPVPAGGNHIVLAPATDPFSLAVAAEQPPVVLDRMVVTGSASGAARKPLPVAIDILEGRALTAHSNGTLTAVFNGSVPGLWLWEQSPTSLLARYGSIRGASSFGLSYPKVYIDGIQVANPLLLTRITPEAVDHIEVIRGPQGAALYGADAISGVANIVLRHENADGGSPRPRFRTGVGLASSDFAANPTLDQNHALTLRIGSNTSSAGLNLEFGTVGAYIPGAYQRHVAASGAARNVTARSILTGTLRLFAQRAGTPVSPLLDASYLKRIPATTDANAQSVVQYTVGTTLKVLSGERFINSFTVGVDGYSLNGVADERSPIPSAANAALLAARGGATRGTLHASSQVRLARHERFNAGLTFVGEQSLLYQWTDRPDGQSSWIWRDNSGLSAQLGTGFFDQLFLTAGARFERGSEADHPVTLPMAGVAWVVDGGPLTVKFRGAYGKGIRWAETHVRETMWHRNSNGFSANLQPEEQSGIEGGVDVMLGRSISVQVTRYDQVASGLIQRVMIAADTVSGATVGPRLITYQTQNVGEITNRGWEFQGTLKHGGLALSGTLSFTDSRVRRLSTSYTGDLAVGDRMLDVPARTMSVTGSWTGASWSGSVTAYRANDWISYDRLSLVQGLGGTVKPSADFTGRMLRSYWLNYPGVTHLGATLSRRLGSGMAFSLTGNNLLGYQRGEPDNVTVLPGRTISAGVRAEF